MEMSAIAAHPRVVPTIGPRAVRPTRVARAAAPARTASVLRTAPVARATATARTAPVAPTAAVVRTAPAEAPARLHLTRRGRVVLVLLALLVVVAGVMGGRAVADAPRQATEVTTHAVVAGETLWQIASDVAAPGEDVRDVVLRLQDLNGLPDSSLIAGQVLLLPAGS